METQAFIGIIDLYNISRILHGLMINTQDKSCRSAGLFIFHIAQLAYIITLWSRWLALESLDILY